jgi:enterobactin synthetase component D
LSTSPTPSMDPTTADPTPWPKLLQALLPPGVACHVAEVGGPAGLPVSTLPEAISSSVPRRQREFCAGRACAAAALAELGHVASAPIAIGPDGAPQWPEGYVGSISHDSGLAAAVVAPAHRLAAVGFDLAQTLTPEQAADVIGLVAPESEVARLAALRMDPLIALTLLFSAREAVFKCLAPRLRRYFDFLDVTLDRVQPGLLALRLRIDLAADHRSGRVFDVRYRMQGGIALCAIALPRGA